MTNQESIDAQKLQMYRVVFDSLDIDASGSLDASEVSHAIATLGADADDDYFTSRIDSMGDDVLDFDEFVVMMEQWELKLAGLLEEEDYGDQDEQKAAEEEENQARKKIAKTMTPYVTSLKKLFDSINVNGSGVINVDNIQVHIQSTSLREANVSAEELNFYFSLIEACEQHDDGLDFEAFMDHASQNLDFVQYYASKTHRVKPQPSSYELKVDSIAKHADSDMLERYRKVFEVFDKDATGVVGVEQVSSMMTSLGRVPDEKVSEFLFELLNAAGDDGFTFDEFVALMMESPEDIASLGADVSAWKVRQSKRANQLSLAVTRANLSRLGVRGAVLREDAAVEAKEADTLIALRKSRSRMMPERPERGRPVPGRVSAQDELVLRELSTEELRRYRGVFNELDVDNDGRLTVSKVKLRSKDVIGRQPDLEEIKALFDLPSLATKGTMTFEEFVVLVSRVRKNRRGKQVPVNVQEKARQRKMDKHGEVFALFDQQKKGFVSVADLVRCTASMSKPVDEATCMKLIKQFDTTGSGRLNISDFSRLLDHTTRKL